MDESLCRLFAFVIFILKTAIILQVETLRSFKPHFAIQLLADLQVLDSERIKLEFSWKDLQGEINFPAAKISGRQHELWQQTCFEAFLRSQAQSEYFEVNLSPTGAWNVYHFTGYRTPQPPQELPDAELLAFSALPESITAEIRLPGLALSHIDLELCAILLLKNHETTYWATQHAPLKPDFHHPDNLTLERKKP